MKILILSEYFHPEIAAPCFRIKDHAKYWLKQGHEVTVVTCTPNFPSGRVFEGYRNRLYQQEWIDGIRVIRLWSFPAASKGVFWKTFDYISFLVSAVFFFWRYPRFDVLLATSPPFFVAVAGCFVALLRRRPWVFEIRDLWPASIQAVGVAKGWPLRLIEKLELFLYRRASRIVSLTHSFKNDLVSRGIDGEKIDVATNGVEAEKFSANNCYVDARQQLSIPEDVFLAGYIGTTGRAHGLKTVVEAANLCRNHPCLRFLIMGEGAEREFLEQEARDRNLDNLVFADYTSHVDMPAYWSALNASIVHLRPDPLFKSVIPSKIFECMAMGTPILMAVEGESAQIVADAKCGICIPSGNAPAMADTLLSMARDADATKKMGQNGVKVAREEYSREKNAAKVIRSLHAAIASYTNQPKPQLRSDHGQADHSSRNAA